MPPPEPAFLAKYGFKSRSELKAFAEVVLEIRPKKSEAEAEQQYRAIRNQTVGASQQHAVLKAPAYEFPSPSEAEDEAQDGHEQQDSEGDGLEARLVDETDDEMASFIDDSESSLDGDDEFVPEPEEHSETDSEEDDDERTGMASSEDDAESSYQHPSKTFSGEDGSHNDSDDEDMDT